MCFGNTMFQVMVIPDSIACPARILFDIKVNNLTKLQENLL